MQYVVVQVFVRFFDFIKVFFLKIKILKIVIKISKLIFNVQNDQNDPWFEQIYVILR